jgi:hypothetical protein
MGASANRGANEGAKTFRFDPGLVDVEGRGFIGSGSAKGVELLMRQRWLILQDEINHLMGSGAAGGSSSSGAGSASERTESSEDEERRQIWQSHLSSVELQSPGPAQGWTSLIGSSEGVLATLSSLSPINSR